MKVWIERMKTWLLGTEYDTDEQDDEEVLADEEMESEQPVRNYQRASRSEQYEAETESTARNAKNNVIKFHSAQGGDATVQMQVLITSPVNFEEATLVCNHLKNGKICVINLEGLEYGIAQRLADFLSGASHALNVNIERIYDAGQIFIFAPENVQITGDLKAELRNSERLFARSASAR